MYLCLTHLSPTGECKWHFHTQTTKVLTSQTEEHQPDLFSSVPYCQSWIGEPLGKCQRHSERTPFTFCCSPSPTDMHCLLQERCCCRSNTVRHGCHGYSTLGQCTLWKKQPPGLGAETAIRFTLQKHHSGFWVGTNLGRTIRSLFP